MWKIKCIPTCVYSRNTNCLILVWYVHTIYILLLWKLKCTFHILESKQYLYNTHTHSITTTIYALSILKSSLCYGRVNININTDVLN